MNLKKLFGRNSKVENHQVKKILKDNAKTNKEMEDEAQYNCKTNAFDSESKRLLKDGHIKKVNEIKITFSFKQ